MTADLSSLTGSAAEQAGRVRLRNRIRDTVKAAPLLVNGYAMVVSTGLTSVFGVVFWMVATRLYDQNQVGLGATLIASMTTISYFGQLNLGTVLNRFLPRAEAGVGPLILKSYIAAGLVTAALAIVFSQGVGLVTAPLEFLRDVPLLSGIFVLATVIWTLFALQDSALSGLRLSVLIPFENTAYAILKIGCLTVLAVLATTPVNGIYLAWTVALAPVVLVVNTLIFRHLASRPRRSRPGEPLDFRTIAKFLSWDYAGSIFLAAAFGLAPLMIASVAGVEANAPYHIAWTITYSVYLVGRSMGVSLLAESAALPQRLRRLAADAFCHTMILVGGAVAVLLVGAPIVLMLFGTVYVSESTPILRVLMLSCLPWAATTIIIASLRALGRTRTVAMMQLATLIVFALSSAFLLPDMGALGVAFAWLCAHSAVFCGFLALFLARAPRGTGADHVLLLAASLAAIKAGIMRRVRTGPGLISTEFQDLHGKIEDINAADWHLACTPRSVSDSTTVILERKTAILPAVGGENRLVLKHAATAPGMMALERNMKVLSEFHADDRLRDLCGLLPVPLGADRRDGELRTVETVLQGKDGQVFPGVVEDASAAFAKAVSFVADLHERTAETALIGEAWAARWIDDPIRLVSEAPGRSRKTATQETVFRHLRQDLRRSLIGHQLPLGRGHGDFSPGNMLFDCRDSECRTFELSGVIDWDRSQPDAVLAVDIYHLALTLRMLESGEELGAIVRMCFLERCFDLAGIVSFKVPSRLATLPGCEDEDGRRAMLLLAWLHHVRANLAKSRRYARNPLWMRSNVDRVLGAIALRAG